MRWRIYYDDGSTVDDQTSHWVVPAVGVQVIAQSSPGNDEHCFLMHGKDFYIWLDKEGAWLACDLAGRDDHLMNSPGPTRVLFGRAMYRSEDFFAILERAGKEGFK